MGAWTGNVCGGGAVILVCLTYSDSPHRGDDVHLGGRPCDLKTAYVLRSRGGKGERAKERERGREKESERERE